MSKRRRGLIMVVTGDGKGKTTSALGLAFRALGNGFKVFMVQYIKGKWKTGEKKLADLLQGHAEHLGRHFEIRPMGDGFTWDTKNREQDIATTRTIWEVSKEAIASGKYDLVFLDEINVVMTDGTSLEHVGVEPDIVSLPTSQDLANHRDPALAKAAGLVGAKLSPEEAGTILPYVESNQFQTTLSLND